MRETQEFQERIKRIDGLVHRLDSTGDPALRATAKELVQSLMDLHGAAIERILEIVSKAGEAGPSVIQSMASDDLVSSLLVLYELHPDDFETRVKRGLEKVRPYLTSRGAGVDLLTTAEGMVQLRVKNGHGCGSTAEEVQSAIREAVFETAPDAADIVIDRTPEPLTASGFVPLARLQGSTVPSRP